MFPHFWSNIWPFGPASIIAPLSLRSGFSSLDLFVESLHFAHALQPKVQWFHEEIKGWKSTWRQIWQRWWWRKRHRTWWRKTCCAVDVHCSFATQRKVSFGLPRSVARLRDNLEFHLLIVSSISEYRRFLMQSRDEILHCGAQRSQNAKHIMLERLRKSGRTLLLPWWCGQKVISFLEKEKAAACKKVL